MDTMDILKNWLDKLSELGYSPAFFEDDGEVYEQVDCIIDGVSFAISPDDEDDTLWFSIIFEPDITIDEDEMAKIEAMEKGVFDELIFAEDGTVHICRATPNDVSVDFSNDIIESITNPNGAIQYLKSISYVW